MLDLFKFFGSKKIKTEQLQPIVKKINDEFERMASLTNNELREETQKLSIEIQNELAEHTRSIIDLEEKISAGISDILEITQLYNEIDKRKKEGFEKSELVLKKYIPRAFAILKDTCRRFAHGDQVAVEASRFDKVLGKYRDYVTIEENEAIFETTWMAGGKEIHWDMVPFDSQLLAGIILQYGEIAEMLNGEGKTLAAAFPLFLNALAKRKVHVCTANSFLSARDSEWMGPILEFHGITVAEIDGTNPYSEDRRNAYRADVVYGTGNEFGFDYLRDNVVKTTDEMVQSELDVVIIDEIDSILIDEARTPLIISGPTKKNELVLQQFELLQPAASLINIAQTNLISEQLEEAVELYKAHDIQNACAKLYLVKCGNPKFWPFYSFINSTPSAHAQLSKFEKSSDNIGIRDEMESRLFYVANRNVELTELGRNFITAALDKPDFWEIPDLEFELKAIEEKRLAIAAEIEDKKMVIEHFQFIKERQHILTQLIKAYVLYEKDKDYVVIEDKVLIVDENTGRILLGRTYSDGLHQALEAKEGVSISELTESYATISFQSFFQKYGKLAGMTATAITDEKEYQTIYNKHVIKIPPFRPSIRKDSNDLVFKSKREKITAIIDDVKSLIEKDRPVLIGTLSVEDSELISTYLYAANIAHTVLNAKEHQQEALIIARAGNPGTVTVAALMAGRGTDIKLTRQSIEAGGLAVIGMERHESRRLDHQLKGRAGRQGDPGTSQFYGSLEDNLMRMFGSDLISKMMDKMGYKEGEVIQHGMITSSIERAQRKVEENNLNTRNRLYEYDSSLNIAREAIYQKRNHALSGHRIKLDIINMFDDVCQWIIGNTSKKVGDAHNQFSLVILDTFNYKTEISREEFEQMPDNKLVDRLFYEAYSNYGKMTREFAEQAYPVFYNIKRNNASVENVVVPIAGKIKMYNVLVPLVATLNNSGEEVMNQFERTVILDFIDEHWKRFLKMYDKIKSDISILTSIEKADPLFLFKKDISEYYRELLEEIHYEIIKSLCFAQIVIQEPEVVEDTIEKDFGNSEYAEEYREKMESEDN